MALEHRCSDQGGARWPRGGGCSASTLVSMLLPAATSLLHLSLHRCYITPSTGKWEKSNQVELCLPETIHVMQVHEPTLSKTRAFALHQPGGPPRHPLHVLQSSLLQFCQCTSGLITLSFRSRFSILLSFFLGYKPCWAGIILVVFTVISTVPTTVLDTHLDKMC